MAIAMMKRGSERTTASEERERERECGRKNQEPFVEEDIIRKPTAYGSTITMDDTISARDEIYMYNKDSGEWTGMCEEKDRRGASGIKICGLGVRLHARRAYSLPEHHPSAPDPSFAHASKMRRGGVCAKIRLGAKWVCSGGESTLWERERNFEVGICAE
ncbi:hypothetical protein B0H19DRAFT_1230163 [Mycena capillaripes]|nr:hypothetical protein B0H19DRAFT_1230163 [Mycena capillaripes]